MDFTELVNEVIQITGRPDLRNLTESSVRAATLKAHQKDFFYKDIVEIGIEFESPEYITSFRPQDLLPTHRKPAYFREWLYDPASETLGRAGKQFDVITPANAKDMYGFFKKDVYYLAGDLIQIRSSTLLTHALYGAYILPTIVPDSYSSWIATEFPWAIIHGAARQVFKSIGADSQAAEQDSQVAEWYAIMTINSVADEVSS